MALKNVISPSGNAITSGGYTIVLTPQSFALSGGRGTHHVCMGSRRRGAHGVRLAVARACRGYASNGLLHCFVDRRGYHRAYRTGQAPVAVFVTAKIRPVTTAAAVVQE
jgi:hypothetical protein